MTNHEGCGADAEAEDVRKLGAGGSRHDHKRLMDQERPSLRVRAPGA